MIEKEFFEAMAKVNKIPKKLAHKIIDGRYRPFLSNVNSKYYSGETVYDAKTEALADALSTLGREEVIRRLKKVR